MLLKLLRFVFIASNLNEDAIDKFSDNLNILEIIIMNFLIKHFLIEIIFKNLYFNESNAVFSVLTREICCFPRSRNYFNSI